MGYNSDIAEDGIRALEFVEKNNYDLILMDLQMPNMGGIEASKRIFEEYSHRPIIIPVTANVSKEDQSECKEIGMTDFLAKPVSIISVSNAIKKYFPKSVSIDISNISRS